MSTRRADGNIKTSECLVILSVIQAHSNLNSFESLSKMAQIFDALVNATPEVLKQLSQTPTITPPHGVQSNFSNPESRAPTQIITTSIILGFVLVFFFNRVYTKVFLMKKLTWDDGKVSRYLLNPILLFFTY